MQRFDLVTFDLSGEPYALELRAVREVLPPGRLAPATDATPFLAGWADVRGEAVPVVDLRTRFDLSARIDGPLLLVRDGDGRPLALRVDVVREVSRAVSGPLHAAPTYFGAAGRLVLGLIDEGTRPTVVLDAEALLSDAEKDALDAVDWDPPTTAPADSRSPGGRR